MRIFLLSSTATFNDGQNPEKKTYWLRLLENHAYEMHRRHPDAELEAELGHALNLQLLFDRLQKENPFNEKISARPQDLKQSLLTDLYVTGALDEFPFKFRISTHLDFIRF